MDNNYFSSLISDIEQKYDELDHSLGWRFLTSPRKTLSPKTDAVFITLNPGGNEIAHDDQRESCENGSPYVVESWKGKPPGTDPLQKQVQALYAGLGWDFDNVLSGQFVPFRSPDWKSLPRQGESLKFGEELWGRVLTAVNPSMIVAIGKGELHTPLKNTLGDPTESHAISVNWGNVTACLDIYPDCRLVTLPHLSTFKIMDRIESQQSLRVLFPSWNK